MGPEQGYAGSVSSLLTGPDILRPGIIDYREAWDDQRRLHDEVVAGDARRHRAAAGAPERLHRGQAHRAVDRPIDGTPVVDVDRGGKITWHGPGQLVGYPIMKLPDPVDVVAYVRRTEQLLIDVVRRAGAGDRPGSTGAAASGCPPTTAAPTARSPRSASGSPAA